MPIDEVPARWYCVSSEGRAMLCKDEGDALANAAHCDAQWPGWAPHSAVRLGDVAAAAAAERERCVMVCEDESRILREAGAEHPDGSAAQDRCFAAARAAQNCSNRILSG